MSYFFLWVWSHSKLETMHNPLANSKWEGSSYINLHSFCAFSWGSSPADSCEIRCACLGNDWSFDDVPSSWEPRAWLPSLSTRCPTRRHSYPFWFSTWAPFPLWARLHIRNLVKKHRTAHIHSDAIQPDHANPVGAKLRKNGLWSKLLALTLFFLVFSIH